MNRLEYRKKINSLVKEGNFSDALELIESVEMSSELCHLAVAVYVNLCKDALAQQTIEWSKNNADIIVWRRCIYEYSKAVWKRIWGHDPEGIIILPGIVKEKERDGINVVLEAIRPVLLHIEGDQRISSELEAKILMIAINSFWLLGDIEKVRELAKYLETKKPASIELANLVMMGLVNAADLSSNFPGRLEDEVPDSFNSKMLSQMIKADFLGKKEEAFKRLKSFAPEIKDDNKERYCQGLFHVAQLLGKDSIQECISLSKELLGEQNSFCALAEAELLLNSGKTDEAEKVIKSFKDEKNPQWLQLNAFLHAEKKDFDEAIRCFQEASKKMASPEVFASLGRLATQASEEDNKYLSSVIYAYQSLIDLRPDDLPARHNLAFALARSGKLQEAKEHFKYLSEKTSDIIYKQNYASCLANTGERVEALKIYDIICENKDVPVEAVITKTELLKQLKNPFVAFEFLNKYRGRFWDISSYLQCYMQVSSQANEDKLMHEAFQRIRELQAKGLASPDIIQAKSFEDLIEHSKFWNQKVRQIYEFSLKGTMPWTLADKSLNHPIYTGWRIRTQELDWVSEEPIATATYSVYSTNQFHPLKSDDQGTYLQRLSAPPEDKKIAMDISSIITLHRLNLLEAACDYFDSITIPTSYLAELMRNNDKLIFHQRSQVDSVLEIIKFVDARKIDIIKDFGSVNNRPFPFVNEHTLPENEEEHYYRLIDIIQILENNGLLRSKESKSIKEINLNSSGVDESHPELKKNDKIVIELSTLKTICNFNLFSKLLEIFNVALTEESYSQLLSETNTIKCQEELQAWNKELCELLSSDKFEKIDVNIEAENEGDFSLVSLKLASQNNLSLYSDDRVIQVARLNEKNENISFGTDVFVINLYLKGHIDIESLSNICMQLIKWRYKFIVPPLEVLEFIAEQYSNNPPGNELKIIAKYAHKCMRDPGLFRSPEKAAAIPLPIAAKLYIEWINLTTEFIVSIWAKKKFTDKISAEYTDWALRCLLPSVPAMSPVGGHALADHTKRMILGHAITQLLNFHNIEVGNKILLILKDKLDISELEYNRVVSETIDAI